jgi:hypothetical protein
LSATYDPEQIDPATGAVISAVRFLIQDTDTEAAEVSDEELTAISDALPADDYTQAQRVYLTAYRLAEALWVRYSRQASFSSGGTSLDLTRRAEGWKATAAHLAGLASLMVGEGPEAVTYFCRPATF